MMIPLTEAAIDPGSEFAGDFCFTFFFWLHILLCTPTFTHVHTRTHKHTHTYIHAHIRTHLQRMETAVWPRLSILKLWVPCLSLSQVRVHGCAYVLVFVSTLHHLPFQQLRLSLQNKYTSVFANMSTSHAALG
jgi:hypothetical protein